jgi:hypothetical protein
MRALQGCEVVNSRSIEELREDAAMRVVRDTCIEVTILRTGLKWKIHYARVEEWKETIREDGDLFMMVDTRSGEVIHDDRTGLRREL